MDKNEFQKLFSEFPKKTSDFIFKKLIKFHPNNGGINQYELDPTESEEEGMRPEEKEKRNDIKRKVCLYELLSGMTMMSYAEEHNKMRMLFNIFDFDNNQGLEQDEFTVMIIILIESWGRITQTVMP